MTQVHDSGPLVCKGCGGGISATRSGQTIVLPPVTMTLGDADAETKVTQSGDGWCGQCIDSWNTRLT